MEYEDLEPKYVSSGRVDFNAAGLPKYKGCYAIVLDSLFSAEELSSFLAEAEASSTWDVAQINAGTYEYTDTSYRNSDRIIYDSFELSDKIFARIRPHLKDIEEFEETVFTSGEAKQKWRMVRMNERLRFLRYPIGGYFKDHQDGCYIDESVEFLNSRTLSVDPGIQPTEKRNKEPSIRSSFISLQIPLGPRRVSSLHRGDRHAFCRGLQSQNMLMPMWRLFPVGYLCFSTPNLCIPEKR
jgi:hypothetical protein